MNIAGTNTTARTHGLFGWVSPRPIQSPQELTLDRMKSGLNSNLPLNIQATRACGCGTSGQQVKLGNQGLVAIFGTPHWRSPTFQEIAQNSGNAAALAEAYKRKGTDCVDELYNDFSFAILDADKQLTLLAIDRLGRYPLYYTMRGENLIFGSNAAAVLAHPDVERKLDPQGIYNYVYFHMVPSPNSAFEGIHKLQAGSLLKANGSEYHITPYWQPNFHEHTSSSFKQQKNALRHNLTLSVERAINGTKNVGSFLSGGLDSSTVTGILSERSEIKPRAFAIGFDADGYDEMAYARITAKHFGVELNEYYVTPDNVVEALPLIATSYDEPFGNSSALPAWFCAKFAQENGIDLLLAGDGGDELFAGNERYAKQKIFEIYQLIPGLVRRGLIEPTADSLSGKHTLFDKAKSYIEQANTPLPDRLQSYNFLHRHLPSEIFSKEFLRQVDTAHPLGIQRSVYNAVKDSSTLNRMLYLDWQYTLADNDIRKVSHMCAMANVDVAYPMLDDDLLDLSCKIPSHQKLKNQNLRAFFKRSLTGWLPNETINKSKQGFGLPFGVWMQTHQPLRELAYDNLLTLKKRDFFDKAFIEKLIDLHKNEHAAYYGVLIWVLTVLELWLEGSQRKT